MGLVALVWVFLGFGVWSWICLCLGNGLDFVFGLIGSSGCVGFGDFWVGLMFGLV